MAGGQGRSGDGGGAGLGPGHRAFLAQNHSLRRLLKKQPGNPWTVLKASKPDALKTALNLLSYRPRSLSEMRLKLESKGFVSTEVSSTIERLVRADYLNDEKFAELLVESKTKNKLWGRRKIASELKRRGLSRAVIDGSLKRIDTSAEAETARNALKRWSRRTGLNQPLGKKGVQKAYRHLKARGFSTSMIMPLLMSMEGEQVDWQGPD